MAKLSANVWVRGTWYGPSYPSAGDPPAGAVRNARAFGSDASEATPVVAPPAEVPTTPAPAAATPTPTPAPVTTAPPSTPPPTTAPVVSTGDVPPKAGKGSGRVEWATYASKNKVAITAQMGRDDIIDACAEAGVATDD